MKGTAKHKYATIGFVYLFGLICASFLDSVSCFIVFGVIGVILAITARQSNEFIKLNIIVMCLSFLISGVFRVIQDDVVYSLEGRREYVKAVVTECRAPDNDTVLLSLSGTAGGKAVRLALFSEDCGIKAGDAVEFEAVFSRFIDSAVFSESRYYRTQGIFLKAYAVGDITVTHKGDVFDIVSYIADYFRSAVDNMFSDSGHGIIKAMFFGDKSELSDMTRTDIKRSGISHLTAVSGMHLSLMVHIFAGILSVFFRYGGRKYFAVISAYIVFLMLFFGMTSSVMRSGFMMIVFYGSQLLYRKSDTLCSVGAALTVILLMNPMACCDIGLILSVAGTLGVGVVAPEAAEVLKIRRFGIIGRSMFPSLCASLCTMPVGALCFGGMSFAGPVTCLLVEPFFTAILVLVPFAALLPFLSAPVMFIAGWSAQIMEAIARLMGSTPLSYTETDDVTIALFLLFLVTGTALSAAVSGKKRFAVLSASLTILAFASSLAIYGIISFDDIKISVDANSGKPAVIVEDRTGVSFFMLSDSSDTAGIIYENSAGSTVNFVCVSENAVNTAELSEAGRKVHFPADGNMEYNISGEYSTVVNNGEIILCIRGITVGILPAGSDTLCDIAIYSGYRENYGKGGISATILCDKKYYNCGEAVNAFLRETEIVIDSGGRYALCIQ